MPIYLEPGRRWGYPQGTPGYPQDTPQGNVLPKDTHALPPSPYPSSGAKCIGFATYFQSFLPPPKHKVLVWKLPDLSVVSDSSPQIDTDVGLV